jgi:two-component system CheB/CheR fusion protein
VAQEFEVTDDSGAYMQMRILPFVTIDKKIEGLVVTFVNISETKKAEQELMVSEDRYQKLFAHMTEAFAHGRIITNAKGKAIDWEYLSVNPAFEQLSGLTADELIGRKFTKVQKSLAKDTVDWLGLFAEAALKGKGQHREVFSPQLGGYFAVNTFQPVEGEWAATISNITDRVNTEKELVLNQDRLNEAQSIAKLGYFEHSFAENTVWWSDMAYTIFGFTKRKTPPPFEEFVKQLSQEDADRLKVLVKNAELNGEGYETFYTYTMPDDDSTKYIQVYADVVLDENN